MIPRAPHAHAGDDFDLIVVGGGVYGAAIALEASRRGLRPLLLEREDFGGATSANSLRILHGGLRYLQTADPVSFREAVVERRWWIRHFPELVRPLPCLMPLHGEGVRRRAFLGPALLLNDVLSADRNRGIPETHRLPRGRLLGKDETVETFPLTRRENLQGAALWYDGHMISPHRLIMEMLRWSAAMGAQLLNYVEAVDVIGGRGQIGGIRGRDVLNADELEFRAPVVINAAGPWCRQLSSRWSGDDPGLFRPSLAYNVLLDRPLPFDGAVGAASRLPGGQVLFLCSHGSGTIAGTGHQPWPEDGAAPDRVPEETLSRFLSHVRSAVPDFTVTEENVVRHLCGLLPAREHGSARLVRRPMIVHHGRHGGPQGLVSVSGVKFTTAPAVARRCLEQAFPALGARNGTQEDGVRPAARPWISPKRFRKWFSEDRTAAVDHVRSLIGEEAVTSLTDLTMRRLDWGLEMLGPEGAAGLLEATLGSHPEMEFRP